MQYELEFNKYLCQALGSTEADKLLKTISNSIPETSLRLNLAKPAQLEILPSDAPVVKWNKNGFYLPSRPSFTFDPALHQGLYYVQEASSMFIAHIIEQIVSATGNQPLQVLDACAAPGGKTTAVADMLPVGSTIVANEYDRRRASILTENIAKWGNPAVIVTQGDTAGFQKLRGIFDIVIIDAPCSGEGMMRKDLTAVEQWSPGLVAQCAARQREIIDNLVECIAPGGFLIYSTCTFNRTENEEIIDWLTEKYDLSSVDITVDTSWGIVISQTRDAVGFRFLPSRLRGEGLFMSVLQKSGDLRHRPISLPRVKTLKEVSSLAPSLNAIKYGDAIYGLPASSLLLLNEIKNKTINIIAPGVEIATVKGRDIIPATPLALSTALNVDAFPKVEISREEALTYLRRESVVMPGETPKGYNLLIYNGYPLGFIKNIGNRTNNMYPVNWRIRSAHT